jgi:hypothetical protein
MSFTMPIRDKRVVLPQVCAEKIMKPTDTSRWPSMFRRHNGGSLVWSMILVWGMLAESPRSTGAETTPELVVPPIPPEPVTVDVTRAESPRVIGVAGCLAASCHGGKSLIGGEATAWLSRDAAHRRAYDVLFNDVSVRMAKRLGIEAAHRDARCLACHSTASIATTGQQGERFAVEFGVGCESCHGGAGEWVARHTTREWRTLPAAERAFLGFRDLKSLTTRATTCVTCHVGSPAATVDHDLIAAGHPRLAFEMSAYHALLPKHWNAAVELQTDPVQETRLWAIGHIASAKALSDISLARADRAHQRGERFVAPDLAEFDCQACHHDLGEPPGDRPTLRQPLGMPRWGSWTFPTTTFVLRELPARTDDTRQSDDASLRSLEKLWQRARLSGVSATELQGAAERTSNTLAKSLPLAESWTLTPAKLDELRGHALSQETNNVWPPTWDGDTQRFLAVVALSRSQARAIGSPQTMTLRLLSQLRDRLQYPPGFATPHGYSSKSAQHLFHQLPTDAK